MITANDIKFYLSNGNGSLNLQMAPLVKINANMFPKITIPVKRKNIVYRKLYIVNVNTGLKLMRPRLSIINNSYNAFSIAKTESGKPLPRDGDDINVRGGDGPGTFTIFPLFLPDIAPGDSVSFWIRRFIYQTQVTELNLNFELNLHGLTDA